MLILGVTGTREGGSKRQLLTLVNLLVNFSKGAEEVTLLHGGCFGVDTEARDFAKGLGIITECYPGDKDQYLKNIDENEVCHEPKPYLLRNGIIVERCHLLIAVPATSTPQSRGGTWYTIRKAREYNKSCVILDR